MHCLCMPATSLPPDDILHSTKSCHVLSSRGSLRGLWVETYASSALTSLKHACGCDESTSWKASGRNTCFGTVFPCNSAGCQQPMHQPNQTCLLEDSLVSSHKGAMQPAVVNLVLST